MPDISDVTQAMASLCAQACYPAGEGQPSVTGQPITILPGWPNELALDGALKAGAAYVSVFNMPKMDADKTQLDDGWMERPGPSPSYSLTILGQTITVGGAAPDPFITQNFAIALGGSPRPVLYSPPSGRTAAQVAADLANLMTAAGAQVSVSGADIIVSPLFRIAFARIGTIGSAITEVSRAEKSWMVSIWAPSNDDRATIGKAIKPALDQIPFLTFANDYSARIKPAGAGGDRDDAARPGVYRRDLIYAVQVPTTVTIAAPQIVAFETDLQTPDGETIAETLD